MAVLEQWVLDSLALNDDTVLTLEAITDTPAAKKPEWISGADSDGEILGRPPKAANKVIEMRLRVVQQATMDLAVAKIALVLDKLQECEQNANGLALVWTPADGTKTVTWRALLGEITDLPKDWQDSGWFVRSPAFTVRLTCLPVGKGTEYLAGTVTSSDPMHVVTITDVPGDGEYSGRLVFTEAASQSRRWICWGLESRWLPTSSAPSLIVDSTSMVTSGYAGATATRSGAYSGATNNVISATLRTQVQAICGLGNLTHVGDFRPQLRFYASATTMRVRLTYQSLDNPYRSLSWTAPVVAGWNHVDLGLVPIPFTALGSQRWTGRIEAYSTATGGEVLDVDVACIVPASLYGRARATYRYSPGVLVARDEFSSITAGTVLNARVAPTGGTWATSGATTDFTAADFAIGAETEETMSRATTSDASRRYGILGSTNYAATEVATRFYATAPPPGSALPIMGVIARWVDASNHVAVIVNGAEGWSVQKVVAGTTTTLTSGTFSPVAATWYEMRVVIHASGAGYAWLLDSNGAAIQSCGFSDAVLATGGTLDDGKPGIVDSNTSSDAITRHYDNFYAATPAAEPMACYAGQSIEFRSDTTLREDSTGTYAGMPPEYRGSRFRGWPAGTADRQTRIAVIARRNDVEVAADDNIADSGTVDVYITPGYTAVPR
jgi:hypothetical protein